jgi:hypothetical protein
VETRSSKLGEAAAPRAWSREQGVGAGAKSKEQRAGSRELETPRVSVLGYPFSVIRWTKGSRNTGPVAAERGERWLFATANPSFGGSAISCRL